MFQNFIMKAMLKKQLAQFPQEVQDKILGVVEKNPGLFIEIAKEVKAKMDKGMSQEDALKKVMETRGDTVKGLM